MGHRWPKKGLQRKRSHLLRVVVKAGQSFGVLIDEESLRKAMESVTNAASARNALIHGLKYLGPNKRSVMIEHRGAPAFIFSLEKVKEAVSLTFKAEDALAKVIVPLWNETYARKRPEVIHHRQRKHKRGLKPRIETQLACFAGKGTASGCVFRAMPISVPN